MESTEPQIPRFQEGFGSHVTSCFHRCRMSCRILQKWKHTQFRMFRVPITKDSKCPTGTTTLMLRNVPNHYDRENMLKELEGLGYGGSFGVCSQ